MSYDKGLRARGGAGLSALAAALLLAACGGGGGEPPVPPPPPPPPPPLTDPVGIDKALLRQQVNVFVAEQKARIAALNCHASQLGDCEPLRQLRFSQGQAVPEKLRADQTVLLIDTGIDFPAVLRYRSRMLGYYRLNQASGLVEAHDPVIAEAPRWGVDLLRGLDGFQYRFTDAGGVQRQRPSFVPAAWLQELGQLIFRNSELDFASLKYGVGHGLKVFSALVENSPQAGFVMLDYTGLVASQRAALCARDAVALEQGVARLAQSLRSTVLAPHGVDYINMSAGLDTRVIEADFQRLCGGSLTLAERERLLMAFRPWMEMLGTSPGTLLVQAAGMGVSPQTHGLDALDLPHRVRVSLFGAGPTRLPADGVTGSQRPDVDEPRTADRRWVDVFLNDGLLKRDSPMLSNESPLLETSGVYGLDLFPADTRYQTSWLTPHALNRLIHLKQQLAPTMAPEAPLDAALIQRMKAALTPPGCSWAPEDGGRCKLQDPGWHKQQELFRQGWLPADWKPVQ